jgi:hypothetical protein
MSRPEPTEIAQAIRRDLTALQARVSELLGALGEPEASRISCPECRLELAGPRSLAEHIYVSHGGPVPDHWAAAEARAAP